MKFLYFLLIFVKFSNSKSLQCHNGGTPDEKINICHCPDGYHGWNCEKRDWHEVPSSDPCLAGYQILFANGTKACICHEGFEGDLCELKICINGTQIEDNVCECFPGFAGDFCEKTDCGTYGTWDQMEERCRCFEGWEGEACDQPICVHGIRVNSTCLCDPIWTGKRCEISKCVNGEPNGDACICEEFWNGTWCHVIICVHGQPIFNASVCDCEYGWDAPFCSKCTKHTYGPNCDRHTWDRTTTSTSPATPEDLGGSGWEFWRYVLVGIAIVLILFCILYCRARKRYEKDVRRTAYEDGRNRYGTKTEQNILPSTYLDGRNRNDFDGIVPADAQERELLAPEIWKPNPPFEPPTYHEAILEPPTYDQAVRGDFD